MDTDSNKPEAPALAAANGSADWLWADVDGADIVAGTVTLKLRDGEKPFVTVGDGARVFLRRGATAPRIRPVCVWTEDNCDWDTQCGQRHCFFDGGPIENKHTFCPYCGKAITPNSVLGNPTNDTTERK